MSDSVKFSTAQLRQRRRLLERLRAFNLGSSTPEQALEVVWVPQQQTQVFGEAVDLDWCIAPLGHEARIAVITLLGQLNLERPQEIQSFWRFATQEVLTRDFGQRHASELLEPTRSMLNWVPQFQRLLPLSADVLVDLLNFIQRIGLVKPLLSELELVLQVIATHRNEFLRFTNRSQVLLKLREVIASAAGFSSLIEADGWGEVMRGKLRGFSDQQREQLERLFKHLKSATGESPKPAWLENARTLETTVGTALVQRLALDALESFGRTGSNPESFVLTDANKSIITGLVWLARDAASPGLLADVAVAGFRKLPGLGERSFKIAFAAMAMLLERADMPAVSALLRIRDEVRKPNHRTRVNSRLDALVERLGLNESDLEEIAAPDFSVLSGMTSLGFGEARAEVRVTGRDARVQWFGADGRARKSVPAEVKRDHADGLKELKRLTKDIESQLRFHANRLDKNLLWDETEWNWAYPVWLERWARHGLLSLIGSRLIWHVKDGSRSLVGFWNGDGFVNAHDETLESLSAAAHLSLWHPCNASPDEVRDWRAFLMRHEIRQPFKQAHREVYILTEAERRTATYSNRFAAHILKKFQVKPLADTRGWTYNPYHDEDGVILEGVQDLNVQFCTDGSGGDLTTTGQLRFYRQYGEPVNLESVPPRVFSEIMRDADLFVGIASIGNDPTWFDTGPEDHRAYWQQYSFGDLIPSARTRAELLETLLPRLRIRDVVRLEGRFLRVQGSLREYRIHLGSGNILMSPNDAYLCIVPESKPRDAEVFLPFEGDRMLEIILSKALMLADDANITDQTIIQQLQT
jgi:hypothetical protein